ncbi:hypothetical protein KBX08_09860 [Micromonospora sp. H61]|nr:hypothetical protein [Micromonospora sp. H61]
MPATRVSYRSDDQPKQLGTGGELGVQFVGRLPLITVFWSTVTWPPSLKIPPGARMEMLWL